ncbi:MAG: GNVR domain-containing protein [Desulfobacterales bacterium]
MDEKSNILPKIDYYVKLVLKKRWLMIIPFCLAMSAGIYLSIKLPKVYKADTLIIVEPKSVPDKFVPSLQMQDTQEQISTIEQQIKSRSNIERLIEKFKLFSGPEYKGHMFIEDKIAIVIKRIMLKVNRSRGGIESFRIEYEDKEPEKVRDVVNWLATTFIDESVKLRELQVFETNKFLAEELAVLEGRLKEIESAIKKYRQQHYGELPEELASNLAALERLQTQLTEKQQNIRDAKNRLTLVENQIAMSGFNTEPSLILPLEESKPAGDSSVSEIDRMKDTLKQLKIKYTDRHPDVIRLTAMIERVEENLTEISEEHTESNTGDSDIPEKKDTPSLDENTDTISPFHFELTLQSDRIKAELMKYVEENNKIQEQIQKYEKRIEMTPIVEQGLIDLNRNYTNLQRTYNNLLDKKLESDISVNMEKKQKGEKFRVVDRARLPQKPVSPDMKILFAICLAAGLGLGGGIIFLSDFVDNTLKIPEDVSSKLHVPLLAAIPEIQKKKDLVFHRMNQVFTAFSLILAFALFSVFGLFVLKGVDRVLEVAKRFV